MGSGANGKPAVHKTGDKERNKAYALTWYFGLETGAFLATLIAGIVGVSVGRLSVTGLPRPGPAG
jgi:hypothetical protein